MKYHSERPIQTLLLVIVVLGTLSLAAGCAPRAYLIVDYQVPAATDTLQGQKVRLQVVDQRADRQDMSPAAAREFFGFQERYSLAWITENRERILAGEQHLEGLFLKAFAKRMEQLGIEVVPDTTPGVPLMRVLIDTFKIDLRDRKWIARIGYEANLTVDEQPAARELVRGEAERVKVIGRKAADTNLSDIFTTMVNRLDIAKLFRQADLL